MLSTASSLSVSLPDLLADRRPQTVKSLTEGFQGFNRSHALKPQRSGLPRGSGSNSQQEAVSAIGRVLPLYYRARHMVQSSEKTGHRTPQHLTSQLTALEQEVCAHLRPLNCELFQRFDEKQMHRLLRLMPFLRLSDQRWVFGEDADNDWPKNSQRSFLILTGSVRLYQQQKNIDPYIQLHPGGIFGDHRIRIGDESVHDEVGVAAVCSCPCILGVLTRDMLRTTFADRTISDLRVSKVLQKLPQLKGVIGNLDAQGNVNQVVADCIKEIARLGSNVYVNGGQEMLSDEPLDDCFLVVAGGAIQIRSKITLTERLESRPPRKTRIKITIERGENLAGDSIWDRLDPYCIVKVGMFKRFQTKTINNAGTKPKWDHTGILKYDEEQAVDFEVYDYDKYSADDLVGVGQLKYREFEDGYKGPVKLMQSKKGVFKSEKMTMVPGGTIYVKIDFDLEYPDTFNSRPKVMTFPDEVLLDLHERSIWGHEQLMLGDQYREVLEKASDGLKYQLGLGEFRVCCPVEKGLATTARVLKVSRRRFMQFLQHSNREEAMKTIALNTSVEQCNRMKERVWKLIKKREREDMKRELQKDPNEKKGPKQIDPSRFRVAYKGVKCNIVVRNALNLSGGGWFDKLDPYCQVSFRGSKQKMTTMVLQDAGNDPQWDFEGQLTYYGEMILDIEVWDYDKGSNDDLVATGMLALHELCEGFEGMVILTKPDAGKKKNKSKKQSSIVLSIEWERPEGNMDGLYTEE